MDDPPATWQTRLKGWRWWIAAVVLVIAVRVALPIILRHVVASQASQALHARVEVGDVDLALYKGGVALEDVAVYALDTAAVGNGQALEGAAPSAPTGNGIAYAQTDAPNSVVLPKAVEEGTGGQRVAAPDATASTETQHQTATGDAAAIVAFKRFAVEIRYWPLFSKTIQLRDIALDSPRVALDRLADGDLNIMALVPTSEVAVEAGATPGAGAGGATPTATAASDEAAASPWKFGLDNFVLRDGRLRFRDFTLTNSEPVEVGIDEVKVQEIALSPGVYGEPARINLQLGVDEGVIDVAARFELIDAGFGVTCDVSANSLPLRRARLYIPKVGWNTLDGELDLALTYSLKSGTTNEVHGSLALRDVVIRVPDFEHPAASWKNFDVKITTLDLIAQRAAIESLALDGADLYLHAHGDQPFPLLAKVTASEPSPAAAPQPTPPAEASTEPSPAPAPPKPWDWSVENLKLSSVTAHVLSDQPFDVGADLTAAHLSGAADAIAQVALALGLGSGSVKVDGDLRIASPAFGGTIKIADLAIPPLLSVGGKVDPALLPSATLSTDLAVAAGLPTAGGGAPAEANLLHVSGTIGLRDVHVVPPGGELAVEAKALDLKIDHLSVPGVIPVGQKADAAATVRLGAKLDLQEARVTRSGEQPMTAGAQTIGLALSDVSVPAALAGLAASDSPQPIHAVVQLDVGGPSVALPTSALTAGADSIKLGMSDVTIASVPSGGSAAGAAPARVVAQLDVANAKATIAEGKQLNAGAAAIGLKLTELTLPGVTVGAPPSDTGAPVHAVATLTVAQPRAVRGDGKEFSFTAKSVAVPLTDLAVTGAVAPAPGAVQTTRAAFGDILIDAPAARLTRTKEGMVLPGAAPAAAPPAGTSAPAPAAPPPVSAPTPRSPAPAPANPPVELTVAAFKINNGDVEFTDRAVQPTFHDRYAPIDLDARNLRFPKPAVKPLKFDLTSAEQGRITGNGEFGPQGGSFDMVMDKFPLTPFNPYARTYSPYGISEGALSIKTVAKLRNDKYLVTNDITLHQLDLSGAEGDSVFEKQFGIPLTMALALLRDTAGDIDLSIPVEVDQSGSAAVDVISVVRSALRQALLGAIQSPLKLVGGVIGIGGNSGSIAPAPIAFPLGHTEPTSAGTENAQRLASFLGGRPAMGGKLDVTVTAEDVRWMHEQTLRSEWADEGFFARTFAFIVQRGPRERIGAYLAARGAGEKAELSAEDAATLQKALAERPAPTPEQLRALADGRVAAVDSVLRAKGIDAARIEHNEWNGELGEGAPVVKVSFRPMSAPAQARSDSPASPDAQPKEEGQ